MLTHGKKVVVSSVVLYDKGVVVLTYNAAQVTQAYMAIGGVALADLAKQKQKQCVTWVRPKGSRGAHSGSGWGWSFAWVRNG